jgi:hypothetical protein
MRNESSKVSLSEIVIVLVVGIANFTNLTFPVRVTASVKPALFASY